MSWPLKMEQVKLQRAHLAPDEGKSHHLLHGVILSASECAVHGAPCSCGLLKFLIVRL